MNIKTHNYRTQFKRIPKSSTDSRHIGGSRPVYGYGHFSFGADSTIGPVPTLAAVQTALNALNVVQPPLVADNKWGPATQGAVRAYQAAHGLPTDGILGEKTLTPLGFPGASYVSSDPAFPAPHPVSIAARAAADIKGVIAAPFIEADKVLAKLIPGGKKAHEVVPGLKPAVTAKFLDFTLPLEGNTPFMYTDTYGLVTTGVGNLIDADARNTPGGSPHVGVAPPAVTLALPWKHANGTPATQAEIADAWQKVKQAWPGVQSFNSAGLTDLRLDKSAMDQLVNGKLAENHTFLLTKYPGLPSWPADAQMGLHSMAWAMGPGFNFPEFSAAVNAAKPDFTKAAASSQMNAATNPGLVPRNTANATLFKNAAQALAKHANLNTLYWPGTTVKAFGLSLGAILMAGGAALVGVAAYQYTAGKKAT